jgi:hypothetical protein
MAGLGAWPVAGVVAKPRGMRYNPPMHSHTQRPGLDRLVQPLSDCLTRDSAERLVKLKADPQLQKRVDQLSEKCSAGTLTDAEREEYARYVSFGSLVDILKSRARLLLSRSRQVS